MFKKKLFEEESDEEVRFKTQNEYAKKYDSWREKEEIHKLEQKYGSKALSAEESGSSDSEDESDEPLELSEVTETQFLKTLALLKTKDPRVYDPKYKFFDDKEKEEEENKPKPKTLTFEDSDNDDDDEGDIFTIEKKAVITNDKQDEESGRQSDSRIKKEDKLKEYLTGKVEHIDQDVEQDLAPLKALWSDPKLNEGEAFLRDYILNKRYLEDDDAGDAEDRLRDDEDLEEDEKRVEEQGKFERAYNFRFEEPDDEYLKRFPRTMNYIRPKDERRSRRRAEVRARKDADKTRKMEEIARLKALKLKEIQEKIARIKEVTGNEHLAFREEDIEGDFDPQEHDRRMKALFDEQYYGDVDSEKPVFPDLDEELEIENWDNYDPERDRNVQGQGTEGPHCEDEDFNMDADYDPKQARATLLEQLKETQTKKRRNRKKKSKLAALLSTEKPKYIPTVDNKTYAQYMEEYYKMDCEDVVGGDLPTRFKYREVVANDFGLTIEEILMADDKELTQWVPLKRIVKHRPADVEKGELKTYAQKAADVTLKRKMLPSLFKDLPEKPELVVPEEATKKKKKKKKKNKTESDQTVDITDGSALISVVSNDENVETHVETSTTNKKKKKNNKGRDEGDISIELANIETAHNNKTKSKERDEDNISPEIKSIETIHKKSKEINTETVNAETAHKKMKKRRKTTELNMKIVGTTGTNMEYDHLNKQEHIESNYKNDGSNTESKRIKKKHTLNGFLVETVHNVEPSQGQGITSTKNKKEHKDNNKLKRKLEPNGVQVPYKKVKSNANITNTDMSKKNLKSKKIKHKEKFKNKQDQDKSSDNPLSKLSDERLKAYGLNPKKYRSFLKYKKF